MSVLKNTLVPISQKRIKLIGLLSRAEELIYPGTSGESRSRASRPPSVPSSPTRRYQDSKQRASSSISLTSLFEDHSHLIAAHINKLKSSGHPVLIIANDLFNDSQTSYSMASSSQLRAILVLLISKAIGYPPAVQVGSKDAMSLIISKQKLLSEITELMHAAYLLHRSVVNTREISSPLHHGNKLATLMGDLLLAKSTKKLSQLKNNTVTELMSNSICDFSESEYIGMSFGKYSNSNAGTPDPSQSKMEYNYDLWLKRTKLGLGSLLANSCKSTMMLGGQDEAIKEYAFHLGLNIGITLQAYADLRVFEDDGEGEKVGGIPTQPSVLWTLPVIYEGEIDPNLISSSNPNGYQQIFERVQSSPTAIAHARETVLSFQGQASRLVSQLPSSSASSLLTDILQELPGP